MKYGRSNSRRKNPECPVDPIDNAHTHVRASGPAISIPPGETGDR